MRYYHVAGEHYEIGEPLLCYDRLTEMGIEIEPHWEGAEPGYDGDVVCLYETLAEAEQHMRWHDGYTLLSVDVPDNEDERIYRDPYNGQWYELRMTRVVEGYPAAYDMIPAEWITVIE